MASEATRRGRRRKQRVTLPTANDNVPAVERQEDVQAIVVAQRLKAGIPEEKVQDQRAECFFGRIAIWGWITPGQYEAGVRYARTIARRDRLDGFPSPFPRSLDLDAGPRGLGTRPEPADDEIDRIKADYADMLRVLSDIEHAHTHRGVSRLLRSVIVLDRDFPETDHLSRRQLKAGLNVLCRLWGITADQA
jgi:hypothetical protein